MAAHLSQALRMDETYEVQSPSDWQGATPIIGMWCKRKGHNPTTWRQSYQDHVEIQDCLRCGAFRTRTKAD